MSGPDAEVRPSPSGPLQAIELTTAAVLASLAVVVVLVGWFVPHASAVAYLAVVPMAVVSYRHRIRAVVASTLAACGVGFLVASLAPIETIVICAIVGGIAGHAHRRRWRAWRVALTVVVVGPLLAGFSDAALAVFSSLRTLTLDQMRNTWKGAIGVIAREPALRPTARSLERALDALLRDWWVTVAVLVVAFTVIATLATWRWIGPLLRRLDAVGVTDRLALAEGLASERADAPLRGGAGGPAHRGDGHGTPGPVPVVLDDVRVRYPGSETDALAGVSLRIEAGTRTAVLGPNGSGKSSLARVVAGCPPTSGTVARPGPVGLGRAGGTAAIAQHPESQVLGVRVADDVVWGLPPDRPVDVDGLLAEVGLAGMGGRDTATLSGGQLQRLAVAAALAREPRLLVADEMTAMVDAAGREALVELLDRLARRRNVAVVAVTHRRAEATGADQTVELDRGRVSATGALRPAPDLGWRPASPPRRRPRLVARRVGHVYAAGTPWAHVALDGVDLEVGEGEGVLVVGDNGSGKSTLAWVLAGLIRPSTGCCRLDGQPMHSQVGSVALAFQHARLQVQRATVGRDVCAAGGVGRAEALAALAQVGLDGAGLWDRSVDRLSGGQLRRVALAGLLASQPSVLVLDEPLAGLDDAGRLGLRDVLARLRREQNLTLVLISHDLEGSAEVCDRVVRLEGGRVVADGLPAGAPVLRAGWAGVTPTGWPGVPAGQGGRSGVVPAGQGGRSGVVPAPGVGS